MIPSVFILLMCTYDLGIRSPKTCLKRNLQVCQNEVSYYFWEICWKLTKYWKLGLICPSKLLTIFCRKLIKIIWYHQSVAYWCMHLTMVSIPLKRDLIKSRSSKWGFGLFWKICWKLTKYWKIILSFPSKMPTIFCMKLIKIIWDH